MSTSEMPMSPLILIHDSRNRDILVVVVVVVAVDVVVVKNDQPLVTEHILSGGGIAMSRAAKSAVDQVRLVLL